ncbi:hypothetical protein [Pedobacter jamesrossensis]|uniref:DUF4142 domain-containing protein n=1 Tax=Pedobacter jamesrossensis TaxID=1908238 RepID=A0ABV8NK03_9SPHI
MRNSVKISIMAIGSYLLCASNTNNLNTERPKNISIIVQNNDELFLRQASVLCMEHLRVAKIATKQGGGRTKSMATKLTLALSKASEELRTIAKAKSINLPTTLPDGSQRPDGRVDSAPDNLRDTSRLKNGGGEAGNTGMSNPVGLRMDGVEVNKLVENLSTLKGAEFDKAYSDLLKKDIIKANAVLQSGLKSQDSAISGFSKKYYDILQKAQVN